MLLLHIAGKLAAFGGDKDRELRRHHLGEQLEVDGVGQVAEQRDALGEGGAAALLFVRLHAEQMEDLLAVAQPGTHIAKIIAKQPPATQPAVQHGGRRAGDVVALRPAVCRVADAVAHVGICRHVRRGLEPLRRDSLDGQRKAALLADTFLFREHDGQMQQLALAEDGAQAQCLQIEKMILAAHVGLTHPAVEGPFHVLAHSPGLLRRDTQTGSRDAGLGQQARAHRVAGDGVHRGIGRPVVGHEVSRPALDDLALAGSPVTALDLRPAPVGQGAAEGPRITGGFRHTPGRGKRSALGIVQHGYLTIRAATRTGPRPRESAASSELIQSIWLRISARS